MKAKGRNPINDKAASKIAGRMLGVQNKFATIMNKGFSKLSTAKRKIVVICFTLIGGGLSIYYLSQAVTGAGKEGVVEMRKFQIPNHYNPRKTGVQSNVVVDEETWNKVQFFKHYMDSLKKKDDPEYYKIMKERPGLLDSIRTLEQIYYSQKLK